MTGHILSRPHGCRCHASCEFPCWQRVGWATPCGNCGCEDAAGIRGHVSAGADLHRCPSCADLVPAGSACASCGWIRRPA